MSGNPITRDEKSLTELYDPDQTIKKITKSGGLEVMENAFISICTTSTIEFIKGRILKIV